ncbi:TATA-binding protein-associated factor 172-like Protein [Tribolium castaneum]|uniref:TATA-binding protein-associated factor 172-like Protein n=1 Tax=Tribolium castaneum TaxID=7070 RepID=D6WW10_TRICA|nr:PREDICTED: TATA-binding protein-associated factor 172 [Tribolium castaneum]XP_966659.1 PREDICTED: TATA-binding protein-associated factor 172 [Tribolium castaneum]EFA08205.1 TATA-binding protein-associated factor 172-like Protein [Tribolium castaneum]|eukprot:XP_015838164.1 PREDICTED: TATA-binding protein-associated factor 172 [Tribolium castaneum]
MTSSRLDRLFVLLETGSSAVTRTAAAKQLGEVQKLHPHELTTLLTRTATYLRSTNWETRIAAAEAVRAIVSNVPPWEPRPGPEDEPQTPPLSTVGRLRFHQFDMDKVLKNSTHLMASEGKEFDLEEDSSTDIREKMAKQRQILNARLGLEVAGRFGIDTSNLFSNEDLIVSMPDNCEKNNEISRKPLRDLISSVSEGLSSREMNRAKRKARQAVYKQRSRDPEETTSNGDEPEKKRIKIEVKDESNSSMDVPEIDLDSGDWPLEWFCDSLSQDLFSSSWETRHGAATALREIITVHGRGAGKSTNLTAQQMQECHQIWLEDMAIRLLCVLALDRFGDFVSDAVVAPVRETCAQSLCAVLKLMEESGCKGALKILLQLLGHQEWEARHGGLLGLKYLLAVREDMVNTLLPEAFPFILQGLSDHVDDVAAVAASALIPVTAKLVRLVPEAVPIVVTKLWDLLAEQDELAAACNSFMGLLAAILNLPEAQQLLPPQPLNEVVPRLWPFLSHSASSVRKATLQTLGTLTERPIDGSPITWEAQLLQDAMRHVYQRVLVEPQSDVRDVAEHVWKQLVENSGLVELLHAACPFITYWLFLSMQSTKVAFDPNFLIHAKSHRKKTSDGLHNNFDHVVVMPKCFIGGTETTPLATRESNAVQVRCMTARMLGLLSCYIIKPAPGIDYSGNIEKPIECYEKVLLVHLNSKSALQRTMAGLVIAEWAERDRETPTCPEGLKKRLHDCLNERVYFDEIALSFTRLTQETRDFMATLKHYKVPINTTENDSVFTLERIQELTGPTTQEILVKIKLKTKVQESLEERRRSIQNSVVQTSNDQLTLSVSTLAALAGATVMFKALPEKLTPVAKPLMESVKRESDENLQKTTAKHLAHLLDQCRGRSPCPNDKILVNLCTFLRCDPEFTPVIHKQQANNSAELGWTKPGNYNGIVTLNNQQKDAERAAFRRSNSTGRGPGRPPATDIPLDELFKEEDENQKINRVQRRGATLALVAVTSYFGEELPEKIPKLWELMVGQLCETIDPQNFDAKSWYEKDDESERLVWALQVLEVTSSSLHASLRPLLMEKTLKRLCVLLSHPYRAVRHLASRCLAVFAKLDSVRVMEVIVETVLPKLGAIDCDIDRQGAVEAIACIIETLQFDIIPYVVLLVVPLLGRMSDQNKCVRLMGTHSFATLVQLMPLDGGVPEPPSLKGSILSERRDREREFLKQLLSPTTIPDYVVPVPIAAELRSYQQAGVNWLAFLNKYKLHGILCDDMGLGKTIQSICMLAGDHYYRDQKYKETKSADCAPLPSLVICPPTLTGHWVYEVEKFLSHKYLKPLQYNGSPTEREKLRHKFKKHNLIVASYDIVRKDIAVFSNIKWNYIILDEGHVIKNGKTRTSMAIKNLVANYRLILSGTPIQNNVLELWSLFDFLMPGFLGTEKQFTARYSRPILASRDPKSLPKEQEAGALAMEALHRQVLPFLLRRVKEDVLDDLPPKITQDYYCELSPLQERLYEDFSKSQAHQTLQESISSGATASSMQGNTHIFQALRYLQNVCNHPKLVLNASHPQYGKILADLQTQDSKLDDISHSAKLPALKQLLQDCGIGVTEPQSTELVVNQHRALVFCQLKAMLDIIEKDLFKKHMPGVTYLRLDGSIPPSQRHSVVTRFNNDPSIDVLLLTTQVGGLGLNLTGADTVIFVEHDWNPMKDLQAMDRAHRIGQRKVVNVYRLITRATLEEKIMGLQKFKVQTVNTIISGNNSKLETMGTDQLLDLFSHKPSNAGSNAGDGGGSGSVKAILETLPELWDQKQYDDEYDLSQFISKLN